MTEFEKMSAGKIYDTSEKELAKMRLNAHKWSKDYNDTYEDKEEKRAEILKKLCPNADKSTYMQGSVQFDYGMNFFTGKNCVIGAGSVVTKDLPDNVFAAGNPCKVIRAITEADSIYLKKELFYR